MSKPSVLHDEKAAISSKYMATKVAWERVRYELERLEEELRNMDEELSLINALEKEAENV